MAQCVGPVCYRSRHVKTYRRMQVLFFAECFAILSQFPLDGWMAVDAVPCESMWQFSPRV